MAVITRKRNPLLERYLESLVLHPILTKAVTNGALNFVQENLAMYLSGTRPAPYKKSGILPVDLAKANKRALKLSAYGFFVSAPLAHVLMSLLQKAFAGKTSPKARIAMILASNLIVAPIQLSVYLGSLAVINGATSLGPIIKFIQMQIMSVMKVAWVTGPASLIVAQKFLPAETWVPFFSFVNFILGTYINTKVKKQQALAKAKAEAKKDAEDKSA